MLHHPAIAPIIQARIEDRIEAIRMTSNRVVHEIENIADADANELSEYRRVCCRYCYGKDNLYQYTPAEMAEARRQHEEKRNRILSETENKYDIGELDEQGGLGYNGTLDPNPDCPECWGEGQGRVFMKDTRLLSRRARSLYAGVEIGKDGIKMRAHSKEKALELLAKKHRIYEEPVGVNINIVGTAELDAIYQTKMVESAEKADAVIGRGDRLRALQKPE